MGFLVRSVGDPIFLFLSRMLVPGAFFFYPSLFSTRWCCCVLVLLAGSPFLDAMPRFRSLFVLLNCPRPFPPFLGLHTMAGFFRRPFLCFIAGIFFPPSSPSAHLWGIVSATSNLNCPTHSFDSLRTDPFFHCSLMSCRPGAGTQGIRRLFFFQLVDISGPPHVGSPLSNDLLFPLDSPGAPPPGRRPLRGLQRPVQIRSF